MHDTKVLPWSASAIVMGGACVNVLLILLKLLASLSSHSSALLAEVSHSALDLVADVGTSNPIRYSDGAITGSVSAGLYHVYSLCKGTSRGGSLSVMPNVSSTL